MSQPWYAIQNAGDLPTPALVVYPPRVMENLRRVIAIAGGTTRLRPHIKTHKMAEVIRLQIDAGIDKFKCATIAEAELAARTGAADVMLAYQPVGPNVRRFCRLVSSYPATRFSTIADDAATIRLLSAELESHGLSAEVLLDVDNGMHRAGVAPGDDAWQLYCLLADLPGIEPGGFHVYDGHIRDADPRQRSQHVEADFEPVDALRQRLLKAGLPVGRIVAGGTPTFPMHARHPDRECSPGTCLFWDAGYAARFPDLDFLPAALVAMRVVSKPGDGRLCLDLGYKAVAPDNPPPRVQLLDIDDAEFLVHSEEHLTIRTRHASRLAVGDMLFGIPVHICPTCALHREAIVVDSGHASGSWPVAARDRVLSI